MLFFCVTARSLKSQMSGTLRYTAVAVASCSMHSIFDGQFNLDKRNQYFAHDRRVLVRRYIKLGTLISEWVSGCGWEANNVRFGGRQQTEAFWHRRWFYEKSPRNFVLKLQQRQRTTPTQQHVLSVFCVVPWVSRGGTRHARHHTDTHTGRVIYIIHSTQRALFQPVRVCDCACCVWCAVRLQDRERVSCDIFGGSIGEGRLCRSCVEGSICG